MRLLLAIAVTVAQVAGPWLCCCGPARLLAATPAGAPVAADPVASGCPYCRHADADPTPAARNTDESTPTTPGLPARCPCGGVAIEAVPPAAVERSVVADVTAAFALPDSLPVEPGGQAPRLVVADLPGTSDLPFLTTEARLWAHHALRC